MSFRVKNWADIYENNRTKELKRLEWVPIPNAMDGAGYTELVDHPNGAAHFGAWIAILEIASRQKIRGEIPQASAGTAQALARISRLPIEIFMEVIPRLSVIGWIEKTAEEPCIQQSVEIPQVPAEIPHPPAGFPALKGREGNRTEGKGKDLSPALAEAKPLTVIEAATQKTAEMIYSSHPDRRRDCSAAVVREKLRAILIRHGKGKSESEKLGLLSQVQSIHAAKCGSQDWKKDGGEFAKGLGNYLAPTLDRYLSSDGNGLHQLEMPISSYPPAPRYFPPSNVAEEM